MHVTKDIKQAALLCSRGERVTFVITKENKWSLFSFCFYQYKFRTLKDFKHISYQKEKDGLYWFLKAVAVVSFGTYTLSYDFKRY
jgi:hypothetical protein